MLNYSFALAGYNVVSGDGSLELNRPPHLAYVLRNFERFGMSRPTQNEAPLDVLGLPDTVKLANPNWVSLTERLQWFWFGLLKQYAPDEWETSAILNAWHSLTHGSRAFTNKHGWNNGFRDYIGNLNEDADPMSFEPIITGGNVVSLVSLEKISIGGVACYQIHTLDPAKDPSTYEIGPWNVYKATISRRDDYNPDTQRWLREDREIRFPQLGGKNDVPIPLFSKGGTNYISAYRVKVLEATDPIPPTYIY